MTDDAFEIADDLNAVRDRDEGAELDEHTIQAPRERGGGVNVTLMDPTR